MEQRHGRSESEKKSQTIQEEKKTKPKEKLYSSTCGKKKNFKPKQMFSYLNGQTNVI